MHPDTQPRSLSQTPGDSSVAPLVARPEPQACSMAWPPGQGASRHPPPPALLLALHLNSPATPLGLCTGHPRLERSSHTATCPLCLSSSVRWVCPPPPSSF